MALIFIAIPIGALFGSTFYLYVKHAAHGYGDSAAAVIFLAGIVVLIGRSRRGASERFAPAFGAALLFAVAVCVRPNLAIGAAVLLGGAGLAALWQRQGWRLAGMCIGFLPVFSMALHNWYYGGVFVLFSRHTNMAAAMPMPPYAYVAALWELLRLDFAGGDFARGALQIRRLLIGPSESIAMVPVHAAALADRRPRPAVAPLRRLAAPHRRRNARALHALPCSSSIPTATRSWPGCSRC